MDQQDPRNHTVALDCDDGCNNVVAVIDFYFKEYVDYIEHPTDNKLARMLIPVNSHVKEMTRVYPDYYKKYYTRIVYDASVLYAKLGSMMFDNSVENIPKKYISSVVRYDDPTLSSEPRTIVYRMHLYGEPREA